MECANIHNFFDSPNFTEKNISDLDLAHNLNFHPKVSDRSGANFQLSTFTVAQSDRSGANFQLSTFTVAQSEHKESSLALSSPSSCGVG